MPTISVVQFNKLINRLTAHYEELVKASSGMNIASNKASLSFSGEGHSYKIIPTESGAILAKPKGKDLHTLELFYPEEDSSFLLETLGGYYRLYLNYNLDTSTGTTVGEFLDYYNNNPFLQEKLEVVHAETVGSDPIDYVLLEFPESDIFFWEILSKKQGLDSNNISVTILPGDSEDLSVTVTDKDIVIKPKVVAGEIVSTVSELKGLLESDCKASPLVEVVEHTSGSQTLQSISKTYLSGGQVGSYLKTVLECPPGETDCKADEDVALLTTPAKLLDQNFTAQNLYKGLPYIDNFMAALSTHFASTGATSLEKYLLDNSLKVSEHINTIHRGRTGMSLVAKVVKKNSLTNLAKIVATGTAFNLTPLNSLGVGSGVVSNTNYASDTVYFSLKPKAAKASLQVDPPGSDNIYKIEAAHPGSLGNEIRIILIDPEGNDQTLSHSRDGFEFTFSLATDSDGDISTTCESLVNYINENLSDYLKGYVFGEDAGLIIETDFYLEGGVGPRNILPWLFSVTGKTDSSTNHVVKNVYIPEDLYEGATYPLMSSAKAVIGEDEETLTLFCKKGGSWGNNLVIEFDHNNTEQLIVTLFDDTLSISYDPTKSFTLQDLKEELDTNFKDKFFTLMGTSVTLPTDLPSDIDFTEGEDPQDFYSLTSATHIYGGSAGDEISLFCKGLDL